MVSRMVDRWRTRPLRSSFQLDSATASAVVDASGTAAADTGAGTEAGAEAVATGAVSAVDAERLAARLGAAAAAGAAAGAATGAGVATTTGATTAAEEEEATFLVTVLVLLDTEAEELMFVLVAGIEFICLKRTDYHSGGQNQSIFIKIVSKNVQFQEKNLFFLKTGHIYDLF